MSHQTYDLSHDVSPVLDSNMNFAMTPIFDKNRLDPFKQGNLQELQNFTLDPNLLQHKNKKLKRGRPRLPSSYYILENQLEGIIQQNDSDDLQIHYSDEESDYSNSAYENFDNNDQQSQQQGQQAENQKQSNTLFQVSNYEFKCPQWQAANPKKDLINKLKQISTSQQIKTQQQKINLIKQTFCKYLCQYQKFYFEQSMASLQKQTETAQKIVAILIKGIQQTFKREIRGLSFQKRRLKLLRYLDKKKRRVWKKKVSYDCRKKVADGRLRIKGKFVTYQQACQQLGLASVEGYTPDQIKEMLYRKMQHS